MAEARVSRKNLKEKKGKKGKKGKISISEKVKLVDIESIADDGENIMRIAKSRTIGRSLPYGEFKISDTTTVELHCNQDLPTAKKANVLCKKLVKKFMAADLAESDEIFEQAAAEMLEDIKASK